MVDLIANRHPRALLASFQSWVTSKGDHHCCPLEYHQGGKERHGPPPGWDHPHLHHLEYSLERRYSLVWWSLRGSDEAKAREPGLFRWNFPMLGQKCPRLPRIKVC